MQHNKLNIAFNQLTIEAFSLFGQGSVKGARRAALCVQPGIYLPLTGSVHTITSRIWQLIDDRKIVNNFHILCSINWG
jgi:hypothetical protein